LSFAVARISPRLDVRRALEDGSEARRPREEGEQEVNIVTTRFGLIQVSESDIISIPEGLVGFRGLTQFVQLPDPEVAGLSWLQSVTAADLAFGLVAPPLAISDYRVELRPGDRTALELDDERDALVYVILNRGEGGGLTVNLQGPLVFNPVRRLGRQLVLTSSRYSVRYPLGGEVSTLSPTPLLGTGALRATA
jgi:flagellar assembly factor FliW